MKKKRICNAKAGNCGGIDISPQVNRNIIEASNQTVEVLTVRQEHKLPRILDCGA